MIDNQNSEASPMSQDMDEYFDQIRGKTSERSRPGLIRWGGQGRVSIIYYLDDSRTLGHVVFDWRLVSHRPGLFAPTEFKVNRSANKALVRRLSQLERAQSSGLEVFVDFWTDENGFRPDAITIATLAR